MSEKHMLYTCWLINQKTALHIYNGFKHKQLEYRSDHNLLYIIFYILHTEYAVTGTSYCFQTRSHSGIRRSGYISDHSTIDKYRRLIRV